MKHSNKKPISITFNFPVIAIFLLGALLFTALAGILTLPRELLVYALLAYLCVVQSLALLLLTVRVLLGKPAPRKKPPHPVPMPQPVSESAPALVDDPPPILMEQPPEETVPEPVPNLCQPRYELLTVPEGQFMTIADPCAVERLANGQNGVYRLRQSQYEKAAEFLLKGDRLYPNPAHFIGSCAKGSELQDIQLRAVYKLVDPNGTEVHPAAGISYQMLAQGFKPALVIGSDVSVPGTLTLKEVL